MLVTGTTLGEPSVSARPQTVGGGSKPRSRPASQQSSSRPRTGLGAPTAKDTLAARPATTIGSSRADFSARGGKDKSNIFTPAKLSAPPSPVGVAPGPGYDSSESIMDLMHDDPEEFLLRLQHQRSRDHRRGAALKGNEHAPRMNAYSRPVHSKNQPLRSSFLDPETNNFPRSKTKKELQRKKKLVNMPHMSYDIDGDGYVSQEDYFMAKRFDMDGNGVLDADEQEVGRFIMAQEFFKRHENDVSLFGPEWSTVDMKKNIHTLATSATFQKAITKLNESEKHFRDIGSQEVDGCLTMKKDVIKHNWYNDKFDTTAWCDFGANPRKYDPFTTDNSAVSVFYNLDPVGAPEAAAPELTTLKFQVALRSDHRAGQGRDQHLRSALPRACRQGVLNQRPRLLQRALEDHPPLSRPPHARPGEHFYERPQRAHRVCGRRERPAPLRRAGQQDAREGARGGGLPELRARRGKG